MANKYGIDRNSLESHYDRDIAFPRYRAYVDSMKGKDHSILSWDLWLPRYMRGEEPVIAQEEVDVVLEEE